MGSIGDAAKNKWLAEPDMSPDGSIIRVAAQVEADKVEAASAPEVDEYNQDWGD